MNTRTKIKNLLEKVSSEDDLTRMYDLMLHVYLNPSKTHVSCAAIPQQEGMSVWRK